MEIENRLIKNTGFVFIAGVVNRLFSVVFIAYAARVLGVENFGLYALIGTVTFLFSYFGNLGIGPMAVREIAKNKKNAEDLFNHILSLRMSLVVLTYPLLLVIVNLLGYKDDVKILMYIVGISAIFHTFSSSFGMLYVAFERFKTPALISVFVSFVGNVSNILVLYLGYGLKGLIVVSLLGNIMGTVISGIWIRMRFFRYRFSFNPSIWKDLISQSIPFTILSFFQQANMQMNILFLSKIPGPLPAEKAMGYYNPPSSICRIALMLPQSFGQAVLPTVASHAGDINVVEGIIDKSTKSLLVVIIFPLILATTFFPQELITIIFGEKYLPSATALTILGWAYAFQVFNVPVTVALSVSRDIKRFIPFAALVFCINIILAFPLILYYSFLGAAVAFLISKIVETVLRNYLLQTIWGIKRVKIKEFVKLSLPVAVIFVVILLAHLRTINPVILFIITITLYVVCIISFKNLRQGVAIIINSYRGKTFAMRGMDGKQ